MLIKTTLTRLAMWSGPRNISTAMMRSFGARNDCYCVDEPFYACYLRATGLHHPMHEEILSHHENNPGKVIEFLLSRPTDSTRLFYQKHMTQHMVEHIPRDWFGSCQHIFLIRDPRRVVTSFAKAMTEFDLNDIGARQQVEIFNEVIQKTGKQPLVIDTDRFLTDPKYYLILMCDYLNINWQSTMLSWEKGPHPEDGIWASHWYGNLYQSTGFENKRTDLPELSLNHQKIADGAREYYEQLYQYIS